MVVVEKTGGVLYGVAMKTLSLLAGIAVAAITMPALAAQPKLLGTFTDWDAFALGTGNAKVCYVVTVPKRTKPKEVDHNGAYFMVSQKPGKKVTDEVRLGVPYTLKASRDGSAIVGGFKEPLFNSGKDAWAYDAAGDKRVVAAMKGGQLLTIKTMAANGDNTEYDFSLSGFSAAMDAAVKACGA